MPLLLRHLQRLNDKTAVRLRSKNLVAGNVQIKIRTPDFQTFTRQMSLQPATDDTQLLFSAVKKLLHTWFADKPQAQLRLIGVGVGQLTETTQMDLFSEPANVSNELLGKPTRPKNLDKTMDAIQEKFGKQAIKHGQTINLSYTERETNKIEKE